MKACPYCGEMIQDVARKCRFCGEMLTDDSAAGPPRGGGPPCPKCGEFDLRSGPWPWYLGTVGAMLVRAVICNRCGHHFDARKPKADLARRKLNLALLLNGIGAAGILVIIGGLVALIVSM